MNFLLNSDIFKSNTALNTSLLSLANQLAQQQYQWGQDQFAKNSDLTDHVVSNYLSGTDTARGAAGNDLSRYENLFQPQENKLVSDANSYAGTPRIQAAMGAAASEAGQSAEQQRQAALQDLQSYGIDPSSGRYASLNAAQRAQEAASEAGAANTARAQTEQVGRGLRSEAIQVGQRYPGQVVNYLNTALQGLTGAENATLANTNTGVNAMGSPVQWDANAISTLNAQTNATNAANKGGSRVNWPNSPVPQAGGGGGGGSQPYRNTDPVAPSAVPGGPGGINAPPGTSGDWTPSASSGGGGQNSVSSNPDAPLDWGNNGATSTDPGYTDPGFVEGSFAGGGAATGSSSHGAIPLGDDATSGGHVARSLSPSRGKVTDDIPARLNADEFVVPRDAVQWKGHEFFHKLIKKSREDRHETVHASGAKPKMKPAIAAPPRFVSHHVQSSASHGALPIG